VLKYSRLGESIACYCTTREPAKAVDVGSPKLRHLELKTELCMKVIVAASRNNADYTACGAAVGCFETTRLYLHFLNKLSRML
jgi:hypothetical protein